MAKSLRQEQLRQQQPCRRRMEHTTITTCTKTQTRNNSISQLLSRNSNSSSSRFTITTSRAIITIITRSTAHPTPITMSCCSNRLATMRTTLVSESSAAGGDSKLVVRVFLCNSRYRCQSSSRTRGQHLVNPKLF